MLNQCAPHLDGRLAFQPGAQQNGNQFRIGQGIGSQGSQPLPRSFAIRHILDARGNGHDTDRAFL